MWANKDWTTTSCDPRVRVLLNYYRHLRVEPVWDRTTLINGRERSAAMSNCLLKRAYSKLHKWQGTRRPIIACRMRLRIILSSCGRIPASDRDLSRKSLPTSAVAENCEVLLWSDLGEKIDNYYRWVAFFQEDRARYTYIYSRDIIM